MHWAPVSPHGAKGSASVSAGTAATTTPARSAGGATSSTARTRRSAGISYDGGYQEYMVAPVEALAAIPESLNAAEAAPLLCAGITTFNALRHSGAHPGTWSRCWVSAVSGHLGIQFASKFGYKVAAIGRGPEDAPAGEEARCELLHRQQVGTAGGGAAPAGRRAGGSGDGAELESHVRGDRWAGAQRQAHGARRLGADPIAVTPLQLITGSRTIQGWASGTPADSEDTLRFAELSGVRPMIETYPLAKAAEGYARMMSGKAEFRVVLTM